MTDPTPTEEVFKHIDSYSEKPYLFLFGKADGECRMLGEDAGGPPPVIRIPYPMDAPVIWPNHDAPIRPVPFHGETYTLRRFSLPKENGGFEEFYVYALEEMPYGMVEDRLLRTVFTQLVQPDRLHYRKDVLVCKASRTGARSLHALLAEARHAQERLASILTALRDYTPNKYFCHNPMECAGRSSCPRARACNDCEPRTPSAVLLAAADLIERTGWTQGTFAKDSRGNPIRRVTKDAVCFPVSQAILQVCGNRIGLCVEAREQFMKTVNYPIRAWNDAPGRTKEEVVTALREAAKSAG